MKKNLLIIVDDGDVEFFTSPGKRAYEGLGEFFNIFCVNKNEVLISENEYVTQIWVKIGRQWKTVEELMISASILWFCDDFNDCLWRIRDIFEEKGIFMLNKNISGKFTKLNTYAILRRIGYPHRIIPNYYAISNRTFIRSVITWLQSMIPGMFIMKGNKGFGGNEVMDYETFLSRKRSYALRTNTWIYQQFIQNDGDIRVLVCGDWIFSYKRMRRNITDLTNNVSQGGSTGLYEISQDLREEIIDITRKLKADYIAFDYIYDSSKKQWYILELNETNIGTKGVMELSGENPYTILGRYIYQKLSG